MALSEAAAAPDEEIAADLERSAERAHAAAMEQLFRVFRDVEAQ